MAWQMATHGEVAVTFSNAVANLSHSARRIATCQLRFVCCRFINWFLWNSMDGSERLALSYVFLALSLSNPQSKVKVHTFDIPPLRSETPPQKRSGMARVLKGFHSFTYTPTRSSAIGMSHTCLCLPSYSCTHLPTPETLVGAYRARY